MGELAAVFDTAIDVKDPNFAESHHHRAGQLSAEDAAAVHAAAAEGMQAFGYDPSNPAANDGGVVELPFGDSLVLEERLFKGHAAAAHGR
mmetsp:Transcript_62650/g.198377  ORF Transcript_62650/g.198377 Transcript_62650/m.198377 type:complete len:90 (-) Transcript_62650:362-631(-)